MFDGQSTAGGTRGAHAPRRAGRSILLPVLALALACFVAGKLALALASPPGHVSAIWPPAGIAVAVLLVFGMRAWPGVMIGTFALHATAGDTGAVPATAGGVAAVALVISLGAAAQAIAGERLARRAFDTDPRLVDPWAVLRVLASGGPIACTIGASVAVAALLASGRILPGEVVFTWLAWWIGDTLGVLVVAPLVVMWVRPGQVIARRRRLLVTIPLVLAFAVAVGAFTLARTHEQDRVRSGFERTAAAIGDAVGQRVSHHLEATFAVQSFVATREGLTGPEFRRFARSALERLPGLMALSWTPRLGAAERAAAVIAIRERGPPDFEITERGPSGARVAAAGRDWYVFVRFIEPLAGNEEMLGFDIASDPIRRAAVTRSAELAAPVATAPVALVQAPGSGRGTLVLMPVYATGRPPATVEARQASLRGFAVGILTVGDLLASALTAVEATRVEVRLRDASPGLEGDPLLAAFAFDATGHVARIGPEAATEPAPMPRWRRRLSVASREWSLEVVAVRGYLAEHGSLAAYAILSAGLAFTALVGIFVLLLTGRAVADRHRVLALARVNRALSDEVSDRLAAQRELSAEKERAEVTLSSIGDAVVRVDAAGRISFLNPAAERLLGWRSAHARGQPLATVVRLFDEASERPLADPLPAPGETRLDSSPRTPSILLGAGDVRHSVAYSAAALRDHEGRHSGAVITLSDVTELRRLEREAAHEAAHDSLTGLVNRREFDERLARSIASSIEDGSRHALCFLDLDRFKAVNDTAGHAAGDEMLRQIAALLAGKVRRRDTVARFGGDEFAVLLSNCPFRKAVQIVHGLVEQVGRHELRFRGRDHRVGASAGLVRIDGRESAADVLLGQADAACYAAKAGGGGRLVVHAGEDEGPDLRDPR